MKEKVSALLDGEAEEMSGKAVFEALSRDVDLRDQWDTYCLIGDALRREHAPGGADFVARVMAELDAEPTVLAPQARAPKPFLRRTLMPVAASVMGVAAVGLVAFTLYPQQDTQPLAASSTLASQDVAQDVQRVASVASDDLHRNYMFAHQSMSGGGFIPGGVHYVRTVSDVRGESR